MKEKETTANAAVTEPSEAVVSIFLPSEGIGPFLEGAINGVNFRIPTDTLVEVPKRIAAVINESRRELLNGSRATEAYTLHGGRKIG